MCSGLQLSSPSVSHNSKRQKVPVPSSPLGIFSLFFRLDLMTYIVGKSNQFALECMGEKRFGKWTKITVEELHAYMGFMIFMGLVKLPSIYDHWKTRSTTSFQDIPGQVLHWYLHFADNSTLAPPGSPDYTKLGKVQSVSDSLRESFQSVYTPSKNVSVDQDMIPFKGRSTLSNTYL